MTPPSFKEEMRQRQQQRQGQQNGQQGAPIGPPYYGNLRQLQDRYDAQLQEIAADDTMTRAHRVRRINEVREEFRAAWNAERDRIRDAIEQDHMTLYRTANPVPAYRDAFGEIAANLRRQNIERELERKFQSGGYRPCLRSTTTPCSEDMRIKPPPSRR